MPVAPVEVQPVCPSMVLQEAQQHLQVWELTQAEEEVVLPQEVAVRLLGHHHHPSEIELYQEEAEAQQPATLAELHRHKKMKMKMKMKTTATLTTVIPLTLASSYPFAFPP